MGYVFYTKVSTHWSILSSREVSREVSGVENRRSVEMANRVGCGVLLLVALLESEVTGGQLIREVTSRKFKAHRVSELPGASDVGFGQYFGYVIVNDAAGHAVFCWLFEADVQDPDSTPLTLWLNGGRVRRLVAER